MHIYWRSQKGGPLRAYGDFRPLGGREPLVDAGESFATTDPGLADELFRIRADDIAAGRKAPPKSEARLRCKRVLVSLANDQMVGYVYGLYDPAEGPGAVRYVGQTISPSQRYRSHRNAESEVGQWMRALEAAGRCAVMAEIFQGLDPMAIAEVEQAAIQYWRRRSGRALFNKVSVKQAFYRRLKKAA